MIEPKPITSSLLIIDGLDVSDVATYRVAENKEAKTNKTNMRGDLRQAIIGSRVMIDAQVTVTNRDRLSAIVAKLSQDYFDVTYFDPRSNTARQAQFISDGFDSELLFKDRGLFKPFNIKLVSVSVR